MRIRALSLHQPYASLIAEGRKTIETRGWATTHRGPLLICAAKTMRPDQAPSISIPRDQMPLGMALCIVDVDECRLMTRADEDAACCEIYPKAHAWLLKNLRKVTPFPVKGRQGFFYVDIPELP